MKFDVCNLYLGTLCDYYRKLSKDRNGEPCHYYSSHAVECPVKSEFALKSKEDSG